MTFLVNNNKTIRKMKKDKEFDYFVRKFVRTLTYLADNGDEKTFQDMASNGIIEDRTKDDIDIHGMNVKTNNEFYLKIKNNKRALKEYYSKDVGLQRELGFLFNQFIDVFLTNVK